MEHRKFIRGGYARVALSFMMVFFATIISVWSQNGIQPQQIGWASDSNQVMVSTYEWNGDYYGAWIHRDSLKGSVNFYEKGDSLCVDTVCIFVGGGTDTHLDSITLDADSTYFYVGNNVIGTPRDTGQGAPLLVPEQIVFGGASGEHEQQAGFQWNGETLTLRSDGNVYIGEDAALNRVGTESNYIGYRAGDYTLGSGDETDYSNGFGYYALYNNTGANNNGFGTRALLNNTGDYSNGFGNYALYNNTGIRSNGFGYFALRNNTGGSSNGFGYGALRNNTGTSTNGFGHLALQNNTGAYSNGFGYYAGDQNEGDNVIGIGTFAIRSNTQDGNIGIGKEAFFNNTLYANSIILGNNLSVTKSNQVVIGGASHEHYIQGVMGIKTDSPTKPLDVNGELRVRTINDNLNFNFVLVPDGDGVIHKVHRDSVGGATGGGGSGEMNVQSDWNQTNATMDDYIRNKPTLFSGNYMDLNFTGTTGMSDGIDDVDDADNDTLNEIQFLSKLNDTIFLSDGGFVIDEIGTPVRKHDYKINQNGLIVTYPSGTFAGIYNEPIDKRQELVHIFRNSTKIMANQGFDIIDTERIAFDRPLENEDIELIIYND